MAVNVFYFGAPVISFGHWGRNGNRPTALGDQPAPRRLQRNNCVNDPVHRQRGDAAILCGRYEHMGLFLMVRLHYLLLGPNREESSARLPEAYGEASGCHSPVGHRDYDSSNNDDSHNSDENFVKH